MTIASRRWGWRQALVAVLGAQLFFWGMYALIVHHWQSVDGLGRYRLPAAHAELAAAKAPVAVYAAGLSGAAVLHVPGWQPVILRPAQASLLVQDEAGSGDGAWTLTCLSAPCEVAGGVYAGPLDRMEMAASRESFERYDMVWLAVAVALVLGMALLVLLPIDRIFHPTAADAVADSAKAADWKSRMVLLEVRWRWIAKVL